MNHTHQTYWFTRKKYGIGWKPASREGWLITLLYVTALIGYVFFSPMLESGDVVPNDVLIDFFVYTGLLTTLLFIIIWKTGEPLKWKWGSKRSSNQSDQNTIQQHLSSVVTRQGIFSLMKMPASQRKHELRKLFKKIAEMDESNRKG